MGTVETIVGIILLGSFIIFICVAELVSGHIRNIQQALTCELIPKEVEVKTFHWKGNTPNFYLPDGTKIEVGREGRIFYWTDKNKKIKFALCKKLEICQVTKLKKEELLVACGYNGIYYVRKVKKVENGGDIICSLLEKEDVEEPIYIENLINNRNVFDNVYIVLYVTKD